MSKGKNDQKSSAYSDSVAGLTAGFISTVVCHPLDLVKTRLQGRFMPYVSENLGHRACETPSFGRMVLDYSAISNVMSDFSSSLKVLFKHFETASRISAADNGS